LLKLAHRCGHRGGVHRTVGRGRDVITHDDGSGQVQPFHSCRMGREVGSGEERHQHLSSPLFNAHFRHGRAGRIFVLLLRTPAKQAFPR